MTLAFEQMPTQLVRGSAAHHVDTPRVHHAETPRELPRPGDRVGAYVLESVLGRGGMGVVFRARPTAGGDPVALKMLRPEMASVDRCRMERFRREMQAARIRHGGIMPVLASGTHHGQPYLVMPLAAGSVAEKLQFSRFAPRTAVETVLAAVEGVEALHAAGLLHRDLKPSNLLIDANGAVRVADFGLVRHIAPNRGTALTSFGQPLGTPEYMAPEGVRGAWAEVGRAADVWALGVVLYELLTGGRPFVGATFPELYHQILTAAPRSASQSNPLIDLSIETILTGCLAKNPKRRYPTAKALAADLRRWLAGQPVRGARPPISKSACYTAAAIIGFAAGLLLMLGAAAAERNSRSPAFDGFGGPDKARWIRGELASGRAVTILGSTGLPRYQSFHINAPQMAKYLEGQPPEYSAAFARPCFLELCPSAPESYRWQVDVQHTGGHDAIIGLFAGLGRDKIQGARDVHHCLAFTFSDLADRTDQDWLPSSRLAGLFWDGSKAKYMRTSVGPATPAFVPACRTGQPSPWRTIAIEVTPKGVRCAFDGRYSAACALDEDLRLAAIRASSYYEIDRPIIATDLTGPLGVVLLSGQARFRNATLSPLLTKD